MLTVFRFSRCAPRRVVHFLRTDRRRHILRQIDQHRPRPARRRDHKRLVNHPRQFPHVLDEIIPLCAWPRDARHVRFLKRVIADDLGRAPAR